MIDWDFETRLIDRIAARELIAAVRLDPRHQRILAGYYRHGDTLREVGQHEGISPERVRQLLLRFERRVRGVRADKATPHTRTVVPPGFDRAAFLRHMQGLIAHRAVEARETFERERAALDDLIEGETPPPPPKPPPPKPPPPGHELPPLPWYSKTPFPPPQKQAVEPWFDPAEMPSVDGMREIARYAVGFFAAMRGSLMRGSLKTAFVVVLRSARFVCRRDADAIAAALSCLARGLPVPAYQPSAMDELLAAEADADRAVVRVVSAGNGQDVAVNIKWHAIE